MASKRTPDERSDFIKKTQARGRKGYKTNLKKRTVVSDEELVIIKDCIVSLKLVGYTNTQISSIVGLSKGQTRDVINDPNFQSRLSAISKKLPEAAYRLGQAYLIEAVQAVLHVMRTEQDNALVLKAAAELFDRFGIPKNTKTEIKTEKPVDETATEIPKNVMDKLRQATPETQEAIAGLHEGFLEGVERILSGGNSGNSDEE